MKVLKTIKQLRTYLTPFRSEKIGFVPTMGALHNGHLSLIHLSRQQNEVTVCSIYVNPKQFNNQEDLVNYPSDLKSDLEKLESVNCDAVFIPSTEEMFDSQKPSKTDFHFGIASEVMEAKYRPGHFEGVSMVIERFFDIIQPSRAYFGEKDFQQLVIVRALVNQLKLPIEIIGCPTIREKNGLAMSSRNKRLSENQIEAASEIAKTLFHISQNRRTHSVKELKDLFNKRITKNELLNVEYFEIADRDTLKPIVDWNESENCMAFASVNVSNIRLIDNVSIIN